MSKTRIQGFTLLELMIALAVVGILSSIAVPSYTSFTENGRINDGREDVYRIMRQQERYFLNNMTYTTTLGNGGIGYTVNTGGKVTSPEGYYLLSASVCVAPATIDIGRCVRITATGVGQQSDSIFWLENEGNKSSNL